MAEKPKAAVIGAFILASLALVVVAIGLWGGGKLFQEKERAVCYFPGSVNGLDVGAPVKYRGVQIGTVVDIRIRYEQAPEDTRIPVFLDIQVKRIRERTGREEPLQDLLKEWIGRGLRARLETQSLVTGQLYVNLALYPGTPVELAHVGPSEYPEIPTLPTTLEEATKSLTALLRQIRDANIAGIAQSLASTIEGINRLVNKPAIGKALGELPPAIASVRKLTDEVQAVLATRGPVLIDLQRTLIEFQKAAQSVAALAEYLQRNPNALLVGRKRP
jgi:paraquat-inducible protein B